MKLEMRIELITASGEEVTTLDCESNAALYVMEARGTAPEILLWGSRVFKRVGYVKHGGQCSYREVFAMAVF